MPASRSLEGLPIAPTDVDAAARRLDGVAHRTPVLHSTTLDAVVGGRVLLKAELFQRSGSFKFRGAYNALASLTDEVRARGVVAFSSGNHAQAVALAARLFGVPAVILMPEDAPAAKVEATKGYGAEVVRFDRYRDDREALGRALREERGMSLIPPFDLPAIMAGQGTAAAELVDDAGPLDVLVVPVGGGGLISGCAVAAVARLPQVRVVGVEPEAGDDTRRSLVAGRRLTIDVPHTIADGLQTTGPGEHTFSVEQRLVDEVVTVTDDQIAEAMRFLLDRMKVVTEPSGAVGVAALLAGAVDVAGGTAGVILSGGNVGSHRLAQLLA